MNKAERRQAIKRFFAIILIVILILMIIVNLIGRVDFGYYSETFVGKLSSTAYATAEEAANDYINKEINGYATSSTYISCRALEKVEIKKTPLFALDDDVTDMEITEISYEYEGVIYTTEMYVCQLQNNAFKYYVPEPKIGLPLTKSYFDSVMNPEKYINFTMTRTCTSGVGFFGINFKTDVTDTLKVDNGVAYLGEGLDSASTEMITECYLKESSSGLSAVTKQTLDMDLRGIVNFIKWLDGIFNFTEDESFWDGVEEGYRFSEDGIDLIYKNGRLSVDMDWTEINAKELIGEINSINELARIGFPGKIDHSYFVKTQKGFAVNPLKKDEFTEEMLKAAASIQGVQNEEDMEMIMKMCDWDFDGSYYVSEGKLVKSVLKRKADCSKVDWEEMLGANAPDWLVSFFKNYSISASEENVLTNFGGTSVVVPEDLAHWRA